MRYILDRSGTGELPANGIFEILKKFREGTSME